MDKFTLRKKNILLFVLMGIAICCLLLFLVFSNRSVKAENSSPLQQPEFTEQVVLPQSKTEVFDFNGSTPKDALYINDNCYAIINNDKSLWVFKNGEYKQCSKDDHGHIRYLSDTKFVVSSRNNLFVFDTETEQYSEIYFGSTQLSASFFDLAGNNLVIKSDSGSMYSYSIDQNGQITSNETGFPHEAKSDSYVAVTSEGMLFYIGNDGFLHQDGVQAPLCNLTGISTMTAHEGNLFFIANSNVYRLSLNDYQLTLLTILPSFNQLGNVTAPGNISFKGQNLLICDSTVGAVQEFKIEGNNLIWTGFAIARNKTAFNRITDTACEIERYNNLTAVLSSDRITVIKQNQEYNPYSQNSFINLFAQDFSNALPEKFALGNGTLALINNNPVRLSFYYLNTANGNYQTITLPADLTYVNDICYQSGYYYILARNNDDKLVTCKIDETSKQTVETKLFDSKNNPIFTVDVYGEIYIFSQDAEGIIKVATDLKGNVFGIKTDGFYKLNKQSQLFELVASANGNLESFSLGFDKKEVYYLYNDSEFIYSTQSLDNVAITGTTKPDEYVTTDFSAKDQPLKYYTSDGTTNIYAVTLDQNNQFVFSSLQPSGEDYLFLCEVPQIGLYALLGQDGMVVLADLNESDLTELSTSSIDQTVYITTDVNAYYLPIITRQNLYSLSYSQTQIRLPKATQIHASKMLTFLERNYYLATFEYGGQTHLGYVPVEFTTQTLSEDFEYSTFTIENAKGVSVYSDKQLTSAIYQLSDGQTIRVFDTENGITRIQYLENGEWKYGFINSSDIKDVPNTTIRNVLIVLAVTACLCGTITFFVLRKKEQ